MVMRLQVFAIASPSFKDKTTPKLQVFATRARVRMGKQVSTLTTEPDQRRGTWKGWVLSQWTGVKRLERARSEGGNKVTYVWHRSRQGKPGSVGKCSEHLPVNTSSHLHLVTHDLAFCHTVPSHSKRWLLPHRHLHHSTVTTLYRVHGHIRVTSPACDDHHWSSFLYRRRDECLTWRINMSNKPNK
jgi:hypothetical protein